MSDKTIDGLYKLMDVKERRDVLRGAILDELRRINRRLPHDLQALLATEDLISGEFRVALTAYRKEEANNEQF